MPDGGLPDGFDIRFAEEADNDQLVEVSRSSIVRLGDARVVIDPGDDYFLPFRLMEEWTALVVTHHERVVGVQCASSFPGTFEGEHARISQIMHTRFHPDYARMGLWSHLQGRMIAAGRERAASFARGEARALASDAPLVSSPDMPAPTKLVGVAYVSVENAAVQRLYAGVRPWAARPLRITIPCVEAGGGASAIRRATLDDAEAIVAILNAHHCGEELFAPYTTSSLRARLERAPDLYTWSDVLVADGAVLGVWRSPETRIRTENGETALSRRALILDAGFAPGAEDAFVALVRTAGAEVAGHYDHLSIFTVDTSPARPVLQGLAERIEPYDVIVPFIDEPAGLAGRGIYVDQAYF